MHEQILTTALSYSQYYISQIVVENNDSEGSVFSLKAPPTSSRCSLEPSTQALAHFVCKISAAELAAIMAWLSVTVLIQEVSVCIRSDNRHSEQS